MDVRFADPRLELIETDRAAETTLPFAVISSARTKLRILRAAPDCQTLLNWRSFGLAQGAAFPGTHPIHISDKWRMFIDFKEDKEPCSTVMSVQELAISGAVA